ncbi:hypothetical protein [Mucilaginibacter terrae]|uniref:Uncharacterized protein n=1 Tax=Mucilaginibacter terrae TaxID=1955052 RepID=A0ABU3H0M5_9SPHI|nr:hypothetical protein [Mucilaginibacter terrae]MDT3404797.1 hypothetical protein [Mucilaginibacter terrae]
MEDKKIIYGSAETEIWTQIEADFKADEDMFHYDVIIHQADRNISLYIDIDLGGGFEGGSEITRLSAPLNIAPTFKFAIHDKDFLDSIGKFFGLEDVYTGYPEFDEHVIIKTNHEGKVRELFADATLQEVFTRLEDFDFGIHTHTVEDTGEEQPFLELNINVGITDATALKPIYDAFVKVITELEK